MTEVWKDIQGYEGLYQVSNLGNVRNIKTGRVLKCNDINNVGYLRVILYKNKKPKRFMIHRLVAEAFIPNPENLPCVNHKDEDKVNNFVGTPENKYTDGNLEWCSYEYNLNYGTHNERMAKTKSKTVLQLRKDGSLVRVWPSVNEVQRQLGYSICHISNCCNGKLRTAYGYKWCYAEK